MRTLWVARGPEAVKSGDRRTNAREVGMAQRRWPVPLSDFSGGVQSRLSSLASVLLFVLACKDGSPTEPKKLERAPIGAWGGEQVSLTVSEQGGGFEKYCARGSIDQPLLLDSNGAFDVSGRYVQNQGGPVGPGEPARYTGSTDGKTLILRVILLNSSQQIGPFTLVFGRATQVPECPLV